MNVNNSFWRYDNNIVLRGLLHLNWAYHWQYGQVLVAEGGWGMIFGILIAASGVGFLIPRLLGELINPSGRSSFPIDFPSSFTREVIEWQDFLQYSAKL